MEEENRKLEVIKGIIVFLLYFVLSYSVTLPFKWLNIDYTTLSLAIKQAYLIIYNLFIVLLFLFIYRKDLKKEWQDFKLNYKKYFKENIKYWFFALAIMYASNLGIALLKYIVTGNPGIAGNEEAIRETLTKAPVYTYIIAAFFAPIMEELTFRKSLRKIFNNKIIFIVISSLIFGGLHVFTEGMTTIDILYLIPYCAPGVAFAYILVKTDNIFNTMSLHLIHNTILITLQVILLMKGML